MRLQTPNSVSRFALTKLRGENFVSSFQSIICVVMQTYPSFLAELTEFAQNSESSPSRNSTLEQYSACFPFLCVCAFFSQVFALSFLSLIVWISLVDFYQGISLLKWVFSLFFPGFFCVRQGKKILGKFGGFPWLKQNNQGKEGQGGGVPQREEPLPFSFFYKIKQRLESQGSISEHSVLFSQGSISEHSVLFCYRRGEFTPRTEITLRSSFSTGGSLFH